MATYLARHGATNLVVMSRSGYGDDKSQRILRDLVSLGAHCELVQGDVAEKEDVRRAFQQSAIPIGGILQGAMVLRVSGESRPHSIGLTIEREKRIQANTTLNNTRTASIRP